MKQPLNEFAARIVRCGELKEFIDGLVEEHGVTLSALYSILAEKRYILEEKPMSQFRSDMRELECQSNPPRH